MTRFGECLGVNLWIKNPIFFNCYRQINIDVYLWIRLYKLAQLTLYCEHFTSLYKQILALAFLFFHNILALKLRIGVHEKYELMKRYKYRRCGMLVHETASQQMTVEFKLLQVLLRHSTMNQSPYHNGSCKRPRNILIFWLTEQWVYKLLLYPFIFKKNRNYLNTWR